MPLHSTKLASQVAKVILDGRDQFLSDGNNLYLRVRASGAASWVVRKRHGTRKVITTLGSWDNGKGMTLSEAREKSRNIDPKAAAHRLAFGEFLREWYRDEIRPRYKKPHHLEGYLNRLEKDEPALWSRKLRDVEHFDVFRALKAYSKHRGTVAANRCASILRTAFNHAVNAGYLTSSPIGKISADSIGGDSPPRSRVLTDNELRAIWHADVSHSALTRFLLLTGQRIGETQMAKREENLADHLQQVRTLLRKDRKYRLLIIDPIGSYMKGSKRTIDTWKDSDVRGVLAPWQALAADLHISILFIAHFNKGKSARAAEKVTGSGAFTTVTRFTYLVGRPPADWIDQFGFAPPRENGADRVMVSIKRNIGHDPDILLFSCDPVDGEEAPEVKFKGTIPVVYSKEVEQLIMDPGKSKDEKHTLRDKALGEIESNPGISSSELAKALGLLLQNLSRVMTPLEESNDVSRVKQGAIVHWYAKGQEPRTSEK